MGFGPSLFAAGRFGLERRRPGALVELPKFPGDNLDAARSGGDLCVQACADDPQVAVHAIRNLARIGFGRVAVRWSQLGFGKTSSTTPDAQTPRNLFGFKDGTSNISGTDRAVLERHVWVPPADGPDWMAKGSYLVARRIRMHIETWDRTSLQEQEDVIGRDKGEGAPAGKAREHDAPFLKAMLPTAHVRLSHPDSNGGARMLRRGYSFTDGTDGLGRLDSRPVLPRLPARRAGRVHPRTAEPCAQRRAQRVHPARGFGRLRDTPGRPGRGRLVGPRAVLLMNTAEGPKCSATI